MIFKGKTVREAISKATRSRGPAQRDPRWNQCVNFSTIVSDAERKFDSLSQELDALSRELDAANRASGSNNIALVRDVIEFAIGAKRVRAAFAVLRLIQRGQFTREMLREMKNIVDFIEDLGEILDRLKQATRDIDIWADIQSRIEAVHSIRRPLWNIIRDLNNQYQSLDCANLPNPDAPMS